MMTSNLVALVLTIMMLQITQQQAQLPTLKILNRQILDNPDYDVVLQDGNLHHVYNDTVYYQVLNCKNGELNIISSTQNELRLVLQYSGISGADISNAFVTVQPNQSPIPTLTYLTGGNIIYLDFNCPAQPNDDDYYNKVDVQLTNTYRFSFLLNCDPKGRHKAFEFGYLIIAALNAGILISISMHSRVWSLTWKGKKLRFDLRWFHALTVCFVGIILIAALYLLAFKDFGSAFLAVRYIGIAISAPFMFICFNQFFYMFRKLRVEVYKIVRYCDLVSLFISLAIVAVSVFVENWVLYNLIGICICVACIKLFHFCSLKEAYIFMGLVVLTISVITIISHYILERSYNDYATQLSSPLFLCLPDFINNLYKKCSWLPVIDVIIPGSTLSYLRLYDQNRSSKYGGVYTVWGNFTFVASTIIWVGLQKVYPFSVPFCLVTYSCFMLVIFMFAWKRNEVGTLFTGSFEQDTSLIEADRMVQEKRQTIDQNLINALKKSRVSQSDASIKESSE